MHSLGKRTAVDLGAASASEVLPEIAVPQQERRPKHQKRQAEARPEKQQIELCFLVHTANYIIFSGCRGEAVKGRMTPYRFHTLPKASTTSPFSSV